jgi:exopolysaccharide biosynthesis polyprenyl glycosylphosphotransferase
MIFGLYVQNNLLGGVKEYALVFRAVTIGMLLLVIAGFLEPSFIIARGWLLLSWILTFLFVAGGRFWLRRVMYWIRVRGYFMRQTLIVGANEEGFMLADQIRTWKTSGLQLVGIVNGTTGEDSQKDNPIPIVGALNEISDLVERYKIQELVLATSALSRDEMIEVYERFGLSDQLNLRMSSGLFEVISTGLDVKHLAYVPLMSINRVQLTGIDRVLKGVLDFGISIPGVILISPLIVLIGLLIRFDSPGPIIYRRRVLGVNGCEFNAFKFRTMAIDGEEILAGNQELLEELAMNHKIKNDPRITRVGHLLRKYSLDELPQLFNVLRGEMSIVGPRMISPIEISKYARWGTNLLTVRPGITGLWQVSGRSDISYEERVRMDMYYIRNWSIWLDVQLLMRTIPAVFTRKGAY